MSWAAGRTWIIGALVALGMAQPGRADDKVQYSPAPAWVKPAVIPEMATDQETGAIQLLLQDDQYHYGSDGDDFYGERAFRIRTPQALDSGNIIQSWNPETETLIFHKLRIVRDKTVIDVLANGKTLAVLRREKNLESAALDGSLTATIQPEDLRVGDVLDYAFTLRRRDPVMHGLSEGSDEIGHQGVAGRIRIRQLWPSGKAMRWRATPGLPQATLSNTPDGAELLIDSTNVKAPKPPLGAPLRYRQLGQLEVSQFKDWSELSALMAPLYRKASTLTAGSPLRAEIARIKASGGDPKEQAFAALKLVEEQTRYVFLGMNLGGYVPAEADVTWSRRFGDCKGKTALLLALLQGLGIDAQPVFVSSTGGDGLDQRLPMVQLFDHVLVRARIAGVVYWLDGTRMGDRNLDDIPTPAFRWALPVQESNAVLTAIVQPPYTKPQVEQISRFDVTAGLDTPAPAHLETVFRGDAGVGLKLVLDSIGRSDLDRYLREFWSRSDPWVQAKSVGSAYDDNTGEATLWLDGTATLNWYASGSVRDLDIAGSSLGGNVNLQREDGLNKDAPFAVNYPSYERRTITLKLPAAGADFIMLGGGAVDTTIGGVAFRRTVTLTGGVAFVQAEARSLIPDFPAAAAAQTALDLRKLGSSDVFIRATAAAPVPSKPLATKATPIDSAGFAGRGAGAMAQGAYDDAIADFNRAIALDPRASKYVYDRGAAYFQKGDDALAKADFDKALSLSPNDPFILMARGELNLFRNNANGAKADFDAALKRQPNDRAMLARRANAYQDAGHWSQAAAYYDEWLRLFPDDPLAAIAGRRCLVRAKLGQNLVQALSDCDDVLKRTPTNAAALEGRGLTLLRNGRWADAIGAYNRLLAVDPQAASALYGRGIATLRQAAKAQGQADIDKAAALDPGVAVDFKRYGLAP